MFYCDGCFQFYEDKSFLGKTLYKHKEKYLISKNEAYAEICGCEKCFDKYLKRNSKNILSDTVDQTKRVIQMKVPALIIIKKVLSELKTSLKSKCRGVYAKKEATNNSHY